jgi:hypothetical protein
LYFCTENYNGIVNIWVRVAVITSTF